jgi:hypothetical protein
MQIVVRIERGREIAYSFCPDCDVILRPAVAGRRPGTRGRHPATIPAPPDLPDGVRIVS